MISFTIYKILLIKLNPLSILIYLEISYTLGIDNRVASTSFCTYSTNIKIQLDYYAVPPITASIRHTELGAALGLN